METTDNKRDLKPNGIEMTANSVNQTIRLVKAIYNFKANNNDELNFNRDDIITLTQWPSGGWWEGTLNGITGWFPSNYCHPLTTNECEVKDVDNYAMNSSPNNTHLDTKQYRQMVFQDIEDTESAYVRDIFDTINKYLKPLQLSQILPENEINSILRTVQEIHSVHRRFMSALSALNSVAHKDGRIGGVFLEFAPHIKTVHFDYCANHAKFVHSIEHFKKEISMFSGLNPLDTNAGNVQLTACLSASFRRLDKYPALLQELQRYTDESHIDRGDTQRAGFVYRELSMSCLELRRQKEMELEVMLGNIKNWDGMAMESFGNIIRMDSVSIQIIPNYTEMKKDRYVVLFPHVLFVLSVSTEMTSFVFEAKLPLEDAVIKTSGELMNATNIFEIQYIEDKTTGAPKQTFIIQCPTIEGAKNWIELLQKYILYSQALKHNTCALNASTDSQWSTIVSNTNSTESLAIASNVGANAIQNKRIDNTNQGMNRSRYWMNRCLTPHPPTRIRPPSATMGADQVDSKQKRLNANEDMLLLQVIESYCNSGRVRQLSGTAHSDSPQVIVVEGEKPMNNNKNSGEIVNAEKEISIRDELRLMKMEIKTLSDALKAERRSRRKLKATVIECKNCAKK